MRKLNTWPMAVQTFKLEAKRLRSIRLDLSSAQAHEYLAKKMGYNSYNHFLSEHTK